MRLWWGLDVSGSRGRAESHVLGEGFSWTGYYCSVVPRGTFHQFAGDLHCGEGGKDIWVGVY